ncbi:cytochrome C biogenesis protein CcdA [Aliidongia dinghuensis]|uniref:Cytochrome C biogenesis protein CcdA n=1 Tax=Aliidongia dinghuensis TaxID=1867774 RepID=A0A8J3E241_9PROT|nr:cytochrome c biogenesis protein CcdA [Aliidongia dinghuensis]GGF06633.1 cytochrome C biogenesis protein CcdA [Aliidongia dinghuensis]
MAMGSVGFSFLAGVLSTLSPCVLPLLPIVLGGAVAAHRFGMVALTAGLVLSFTGIGLFVATVGFSIGLDGAVFRDASAVLLAGLGIVLLSGSLQQRFALATAGLGNEANGLMARVAPSGLGGQLAIGVILGAVWSPCVGPTLGAASVLAAQGRDLGSVALVMMAFGLGTAVPLVIVGMLSREALTRWRGRMMSGGAVGKYLLGGGALAVAVLILTGADRAVEAFLVTASPAWLTDLTTRF